MLALDDSNFFSQKTNSKPEKMKAENFVKDNSFSIFHALGKFLYNKRNHMIVY